MIGYILHTPILVVESIDSWVDPVTGFTHRDFMNKTYEEKKALGWRNVDTTVPLFDSFFSSLQISDWKYNEVEDIIQKDYSVIDYPIPELQMKLLQQLENTKHLIMSLGFLWNGRGVDTSNISRSLIAGEYQAALQSDRDETNDVFQFYTGPEHLSNAQIIDIGEKLRNFCASIYKTHKPFWDRIIASTITVEELKIIKVDIENKDNWPTTLM